MGQLNGRYITTGILGKSRGLERWNLLLSVITLGSNFKLASNISFQTCVKCFIFLFYLQSTRNTNTLHNISNAFSHFLPISPGKFWNTLTGFVKHALLWDVCTRMCLSCIQSEHSIIIVNKSCPGYVHIV